MTRLTLVGKFHGDELRNKKVILRAVLPQNRHKHVMVDPTETSRVPISPKKLNGLTSVQNVQPYSQNILKVADVAGTHTSLNSNPHDIYHWEGQET